jgi:hypothetical protein
VVHSGKYYTTCACFCPPPASSSRRLLLPVRYARARAQARLGSCCTASIHPCIDVVYPFVSGKVTRPDTHTHACARDCPVRPRGQHLHLWGGGGGGGVGHGPCLPSWRRAVVVWRLRESKGRSAEGMRPRGVHEGDHRINEEREGV